MNNNLGSGGAIAFFNHLNSLPKSQNRYLAAADFIETQSNSTSNVGRARIVFWFLLAGQGTMLILAVWVLSLRLYCGKFKLGSLTRSKVIRLNPADCFAVCCLFASPLTIYSALVRVGYDGFKTKFVDHAVTQALAFLFFWLPTWGFLWSWYGTIISNRWDPPWSQMSSVPGGQVPTAVVAGFNLLIILGALGGIFGLMSVAISLDIKMRMALRVIGGVVQSLREAAPTYNPETWQVTDLLRFLLPLGQMTRLYGNLVKTFESTILVTLVLVATLVLLYPFLIITVIVQKRRHIKKSLSDEPAIKRSMKFDYVKELNSLLWVSLAIWITFTLYFPIVIWQFDSMKRDTRSLTKVPTVILISALSLVAISGNFILLVTLTQTYRLQLNSNGWRSLLKKAVNAKKAVQVHSTKQDMYSTTNSNPTLTILPKIRVQAPSTFSRT